MLSKLAHDLVKQVSDAAHAANRVKVFIGHSSHSAFAGCGKQDGCEAGELAPGQRGG